MTNSMTTQPDGQTVIVGVDTHKHVHVAVAIDTCGIRLGDQAPAVMAPVSREPSAAQGIVSRK